MTQHLVDHEVIIQLSAIEELKSWSLSDVNESIDSDAKQAAVQTARQDLVFGAGMSYKECCRYLNSIFLNLRNCLNGLPPANP